LASPEELVVSPGKANKIRWRKGCDLRSRDQSMVLDLTLPND
jgi:hypothetical protein